MHWIFLADFAFDLIQAGISPQDIAGHKNLRIARFLEVVQQSLQALMKCLGIKVFRRNIFATLQDDDVRFPIELLTNPGRLIGGVLPLEDIRDVEDAFGRFGPVDGCRLKNQPTTGPGNNRRREEVDVVLVLGAGRHAPVASPANIRLRAMQREAVPEKQDTVGLEGAEHLLARDLGLAHGEGQHQAQGVDCLPETFEEEVSQG